MKTNFSFWSNLCYVYVVNKGQFRFSLSFNMGTSEKFCLKWNDFESNITSAFREIKEEKDFFDVTIACGDDQVQAHKVILSACSPFFKNLLRRNQHPHPLLYLKGISFSGIQSVLNFMYHGEANIAQEDLNTFLSVAEELKVKGLTQNQSQQGSSSKPTQSAPKTKPQSNPVKTTSRSFQAVEEDDEIQEVDSQMIKLEQGEASKQADLRVAQFDEQEQYFEDYDESYSEDFMTVTDSNTVVEKGNILVLF